MLIDAIVTGYTNDEALFSTLCSLAAIKRSVLNKIIVVGENDSCLSIVNRFKSYITIDYYKVGNDFAAKQKGLDSSAADYVFFVECGDVVTDSIIFNRVPYLIKNNPDINIYSFNYLTREGKSAAADSKIFGKIYSRKFLKNYQITFSESTRRDGAEFAFNICCNLINESSQLKLKEVFYARLNDSDIEPPVSSIVYAFEVAAANGVSEQSMLKAIYSFFTSLYYSYICINNTQPQLLNQKLKECLYFYKCCFKKYAFDEPLFLRQYALIMKELMANIESAYFSKLPTITITDFLNILKKEIETNEQN